MATGRPLKVLIVGGGDEDTGVRTRLAGRALLWGLERRGVRHDVHDPRTSPAPDLSAYDAILCWSWVVHRFDDYVRGAREIEDRARRLGIPVVNGVARCRARHSYFLETWRAHGVPCAESQIFRDFEEIRLGYPLILRRDGVHQGRDVVLARTPEDARRLIQERREDEGRPDLDLAVELIDTRGDDGCYCKYRSFVVGDRVLPAHLFLSNDWMVHYGSRVANETSRRRARRFLLEGERNVDEVLAAARLTGSDVLALDYSRRPDGRHVFWEANRHFLTFEDYGKTLDDGFGTAMGIDAEEHGEMREALGLALADLVLAGRRAGARDGGASGS